MALSQTALKDYELPHLYKVGSVMWNGALVSLHVTHYR